MSHCSVGVSTLFSGLRDLMISSIVEYVNKVLVRSYNTAILIFVLDYVVTALT
jgi:hypothetical protein